jgi:AAA+ superfamily predicted ATPase
VDPTVVAALRAAVAADPQNPGLRAHLAKVLLEAGAAADALAEAAAVLAVQPDHLDALRVAAAAASATGDLARAESWGRLAQALGGGEGPPPPAGWAPSPPVGADPASAPPPLHPAFPGAPPALPAPPAPPAVPIGAEGPESDGLDWDALLQEVVEADARNRVTLADVAGLDEVKLRLRMSFLEPMRNPEMRRMYGASLRGGLLLWGPPGCGKTFLAKAIAGELHASFMSIGLHEVLDMYLGNSERNIHAVFEEARRRAPSVLFFDEVDALGHKRTDLARSGGRNVVAQLLTEMDGIGPNNDGVYVLGATNQLWDVDPALRRPGRFDRSLLVLPPDESAREAILRFHLRDRPVAAVDLARIARETDGLTGADLRLLCQDATERAMLDSMRTGTPRPVTDADLQGAARGSRGTATPWLEAAANYVRYANDSGEYDELAEYLRRRPRRR